MYRTIEEVIRATLVRYEGVEKLSKEVVGEDEVRCLYGHEVNGVGCAIGCHVDAETAAKMDAERIMLEEIRPLYLGGVFGEGISDQQLSFLQRRHDEAEDVAHFRARLVAWLERLAEEEILEEEYA